MGVRMGTTEDVETIASFKCPLLFHCTPRMAVGN